MIKGSFTSATGVIDIEFNDGLTPVTDMDITQIGELSYSFDITPESVTIDRLLALYSNFKFSFNGTNQVGTDIYEAMVEKLLIANRTINLVITTHEGEPFTFGFECSLNDLEIDERTGIASLLCKPQVADITFKDVFDAVDAGLKAKFLKKKLGAVQYTDYNAVGVGSWIKQALPLLFGNSNPVDFVPSKSGLSANRYTEELYTDITFDLNKRFFALIDMGEGFEPTEENTRIDAIDGTIRVIADSVARPIKGVIEPQEPFVTVLGTGTNFESSFVGKNLYYFNNDIPVILGVVTKFVSTTRLEIAMLPESIDISNVVGGIESAILPNLRPAIEILKELAGIEGSVFGSGFSRNFYINRLADTQTPIELDYANVINAKLNRTSLYLGNSIVTQLSTQTSRLVSKVKKKKSFWDKLFGRQRFSTEVGDLPDDPYGTYPSTDADPASRQLPVMRRVTSGNIGNPRASKELRIELAPAYPLLSKGEGSININFVGQKVLTADGNGALADTSLESALTANGLRNYLRALSSVDGDFIIDFEIKGAFSLKPYETFQFTGAPERYQGKTYRVSEIRYNLLADTVKVKGYKINDFNANIVPSSPLIESINVSTGVLNFDWDTTKPVINSVDVSATGVSGSLEVTCSSGFYSINTDPTDNLWRNSITLNTDGFGGLSQRIYVRFNPSAAGIVSDSLLYGVLQVNGQSQATRIELRANAIAPQSEFYIGQVDGIIGGDTLSSITANMFTEIEQGREITLVGENKGYRYTITPTEDVPTGDNTFSIEPQFIEKDRYHVEVSQNADRTGITVSEREIVLKVKGDGRIASIRLSADADSGSEIDISAEQVKINGIIFTEGTDPSTDPGDIKTLNYVAGSAGWKIEGNGDAEFNDVTVRGSINATSLVLDIATNPFNFINNGGDLQLSGDGVDFEIDINDFVFRIVNTQIDFTSATTVNIDHVDSAITFNNTTDSTSKDTGSIITEGGIGIEKSAYIGGSLNAPKVTIKAITDSDSPYTVLSTDTHIAVDNGASAVTINLPTGTLGRKITIFDTTGTASLGTITINRASTNTINGATSTTLTTNHQSVTLLFNAGNWTII